MFFVSSGVSTVADLTITANLVLFLCNQRLSVRKRYCFYFLECCIKSLMANRTTELVDKIIAWTIGLPINWSTQGIFSDGSCCRDRVGDQVSFPPFGFPQMFTVSYCQAPRALYVVLACVCSIEPWLNWIFLVCRHEEKLYEFQITAPTL
jgi:hypothetical protein